MQKSSGEQKFQDWWREGKPHPLPPFNLPLPTDFVERAEGCQLVVREYQAWSEGRARPSLQKQATYRSPVLFLDPWGWGPALRLPSQPVLATEWVQVCWRVFPSDEPEIPAEIRREETDWKTAPWGVPLTQPAPEYRISLVLLLSDERGNPFFEHPLREWRIPGITEERPLLWFDPRDRRLIPSRDCLPGTRLWVLRRSDVILTADPPDSLRVSDSSPACPGRGGTLSPRR